MLIGIHILMTYECNPECDHCCIMEKMTFPPEGAESASDLGIPTATICIQKSFVEAMPGQDQDKSDPVIKLSAELLPAIDNLLLIFL